MTRVVHVALRGDGGGAFKVTKRIHRCHLEAGIDSVLAVRRRVEGDDDDGVPPRLLSQAPSVYYRYQPAIEMRLANHFHPREFPLRSWNVLPTGLNRHDLLTSADVVMFHWVGAGTMSIRDIGRVSTPSSFRLSDEWIFSGAKHYQVEETDDAWGRPAALRRMIDRAMDRSTAARKQRHWRPRPIVAPTTAQRDLARQTSLFADSPIHVIPNPVDENIFRWSPEAPKRQDSPGSPRLLFVSLEPLTSVAKGFGLLVEALQRLRAESCADPCRLCVVAPRSVDIEVRTAKVLSGIDVEYLGPIRVPVDLAATMGQADILVVPSKREAFGSVAAEAMMCGTPVVAYRHTGAGSFVVQAPGGWVFDDYTADSLARTLASVFAAEPWRTPNDRSTIAASARRNFSFGAVGRQYLEFYDRLRADE